MKKLLSFLMLTALAVGSLQAQVLLRHSTNYPYANGPIAGQGQWYVYSSTNNDIVVSNNWIYLSTTNKASVATPTNGFPAANIANYNVVYASFSLNVSQLPATANGGYFMEFRDNSNNSCCHLFIDTLNTAIPGTYRLGIGNYTTSFGSFNPPNNYTMDLATNVTYQIVCAFGDAGTALPGATLWINPSQQDYDNAVAGTGINYLDPGTGTGYAYGNDAPSTAYQSLFLVSNVGFSPYANAAFSNLVLALDFASVLQTNAPVFAIAPLPQTNYSGNGTMFTALAAGADMTYQWFSATTGPLVDDDVNVIGSQSNVLVLNNLSATDSYYVQATNAYGTVITSATVQNTVITTPTPVFFPATLSAVLATNNLFLPVGFTNLALGTGPITYQWYFAPTNTPNTFSPLSGQNSAILYTNLLVPGQAGRYYVAATNVASGITYGVNGPTNTLTIIAPLQATLAQLHTYELNNLAQILANKNGYFYINSNNITVSGYVTTYGGFGSVYTEFFMQDALGYGVEVYLPGRGNTNTPPVGTYVTVTGPLEVYHTDLEMALNSSSAIVTNAAPPVYITPKLVNAQFGDLTTNALGTNALNLSCAMITVTNIYIYASNNVPPAALSSNPGSHYGNGGIFQSNNYTYAFFTAGGAWSNPSNTNLMEIYQFAYNYGTNAPGYYYQPTTIGSNPIPSHCYQLSGVYAAYGGIAEILPSRLADYVVNPPDSFAASVTTTNSTATTNKLVAISWAQNPGSTYSIVSTTNLLHPTWTTVATGLGYYPTNGVFVDTNNTKQKYYQITTP